MKYAAELDARVAITRAYKYLLYPSSGAPKSMQFLRRETLPSQDQGEMDRDQTNVILRVLKSLKKVQTADEEVLPAMYVHSRAWVSNHTRMSTEELRRTFAMKVSLRMLLDVGQLKQTIANGVRTGTWIYYDAKQEIGYDQEPPPASYQIGNDFYLYLPEQARTTGLKARFAPQICVTCLFHQDGRCRARPQKRDPRYLLAFTPQQARAAQRRRQYREQLDRGQNLRAAVEATVRSVKHPFRAGKIPVRGQFRVTCLMIASAITVNVRRIYRYCTDQNLFSTFLLFAKSVFQPHARAYTCVLALDSIVEGRKHRSRSGLVVCFASVSPV